MEKIFLIFLIISSTILCSSSASSPIFPVIPLPITTKELSSENSCGENEIYLECGPNCQIECHTLGQPCLERKVQCPSGCYCTEGFARNQLNGKCIPMELCSPTATSYPFKFIQIQPDQPVQYFSREYPINNFHNFFIPAPEQIPIKKENRNVQQEPKIFYQQ